MGQGSVSGKGGQGPQATTGVQQRPQPQGGAMPGGMNPQISALNQLLNSQAGYGPAYGSGQAPGAGFGSPYSYQPFNMQSAGPQAANLANYLTPIPMQMPQSPYVPQLSYNLANQFQTLAPIQMGQYQQSNPQISQGIANNPATFNPYSPAGYTPPVSTARADPIRSALQGTKSGVANGYGGG